MSEFLTTQCVGVDYGLTMPIYRNAEIPMQNQNFNTIDYIGTSILRPYIAGLEDNKHNISISDVKILSTNKVVQVVFEDGTSEKAICDKDDTFSLEIGITVCIAKKLLGGTKEYNKIIRNALKTMEQNEKSKKEREDEKKRIALKRQKMEEQRRERKIKAQEEAYYRAMKRIESEKQEEKK